MAPYKLGGALLFTFFCSAEVYAQGMLLQGLYAPNSGPELSITHRQATSSWQSPYERLSKTNVSISSDSFTYNENSRYRFQASHQLQRFDQAPAFGDTLENPAFGFLFDHSDRRRLVTEFSLNSPSNKPFDSIHETNIGLTMALAPLGDLGKRKEAYWLYFLNYSNTRSFLPNIPLPGLAYVIPNRSGWTYSIGAPVISATYFGFPKWSFQINGGPFFYSTRISYGPPFLQAAISSSWRQDSYFIAEREHREERTFLDEKDVSFSFIHPFSDFGILEWKASYFFQQSLRFGKSYDDLTAPTQDLGTSAAISLSVKARLDSMSK